jgi:hypothetical protein
MGLKKSFLGNGLLNKFPFHSILFRSILHTLNSVFRVTYFRKSTKTVDLNKLTKFIEMSTFSEGVSYTATQELH